MWVSTLFQYFQNYADWPEEMSQDFYKWGTKSGPWLNQFCNLFNYAYNSTLLGTGAATIDYFHHISEFVYKMSENSDRETWIHLFCQTSTS